MKLNFRIKQISIANTILIFKIYSENLPVIRSHSIITTNTTLTEPGIRNNTKS